MRLAGIQGARRATRRLCTAHTVLVGRRRIHGGMAAAAQRLSGGRVRAKAEIARETTPPGRGH